MESWHYTPWMCDGAADCTSLGLGLFPASMGGWGGCIPEILVGMVDAMSQVHSFPVAALTRHH